MLIRDAVYDDDVAIEKIVMSNWDKDIAYSAVLEFDEMFKSGSKWPPHYYVAEVDGQVVGCGGLKSAWLMTNTYELIWVNVHKDFKGRGIGKALTERRLKHIRDLDGRLVLLMTKSPFFFKPFGFYVNNVFDGYALMSLHLGKVEISGKDQYMPT